MTERSSAPESTSQLATLGANTHRVEAVNTVATSSGDTSTDGQETDGTPHAHIPSKFDFRLTRSDDTPIATGTVLELFTGYLAAASHAHCETAEERLEVTRIVVDGVASGPTDEEPTYGTAVASMAATIHVETDATEESLERWRRTLRDAEATQDAVPADVAMAMTVVRVSASTSR